MNIENEEQDNCVQSITYGINRTTDWRERVYDRYHDDRNLWASKALRKLATDAHLTQESWENLQPTLGVGYISRGCESDRPASRLPTQKQELPVLREELGGCPVRSELSTAHNGKA